MAWRAFPQISCGDLDEGWYHVVCPVVGDSAAEAQAGAEFALNALAGGKVTVIRSAPSGEEKQDFNTKEVTYEGHVRFSFRNEPGDWKYPERSFEQFQGIGLGAARV